MLVDFIENYELYANVEFFLLRIFFVFFLMRNSEIEEENAIYAL